MRETTMKDREHELRDLLKAIEATPSRDWTEERKRIVVLRTMLAGHEAHAEA